MRRYSFLDRIIIHVDEALYTIFGAASASRPNPAEEVSEGELSESERRKSQGYMRVNHTGEVCAQALYRGQLMFAKGHATHAMLQQAIIEETDHLVWTAQRLQQLNTHRSYLNFFWYTHSFFLGMFAAKCGDSWSLGFVEETEHQVATHLTEHLERLSKSDARSRAIVYTMRRDEEHHGAQARQAGAVHLPAPIQVMMTWHARVMKTLAYYI